MPEAENNKLSETKSKVWTPVSLMGILIHDFSRIHCMEKHADAAVFAYELVDCSLGTQLVIIEQMHEWYRCVVGKQRCLIPKSFVHLLPKNLPSFAPMNNSRHPPNIHATYFNFDKLSNFVLAARISSLICSSRLDNQRSRISL
jgi:hypothetical protein